MDACQPLDRGTVKADTFAERILQFTWINGQRFEYAGHIREPQADKANFLIGNFTHHRVGQLIHLFLILLWRQLHIFDRLNQVFELFGGVGLRWLIEDARPFGTGVYNRCLA